MSIKQLISSLGQELDELRARVASLEGLLGVGGVSAHKSSDADGSCRICGITWQLCEASFPQHMAGKRHKKNLERLFNTNSNVLTPASSKKGTGHTQYRTTMCNKDILNGMPQIQGDVLGRLQSITCMKEYKRKSFEELRWEDVRAGRREENFVDKVVDGLLGEEDGDTLCKENEGVALVEIQSAAYNKSALTEGVEEDRPAAEATGDLKSCEEELEEAGSVDRLAGAKKSDQRSLAVSKIISIRPRLKGHARKVS